MMPFVLTSSLCVVGHQCVGVTVIAAVTPICSSCALILGYPLGAKPLATCNPADIEYLRFALIAD